MNNPDEEISTEWSHRRKGKFVVVRFSNNEIFDSFFYTQEDAIKVAKCRAKEYDEKFDVYQCVEIDCKEQG